MKGRSKKIRFNFVLVGFSLLLLGSGGMMLREVSVSRSNAAVMESLAVQVQTEAARDTGATGNPVIADGKTYDRYQSLKEENPDLTGWIAIPGTKIDYPVMQTPDTPDFYLNHNFRKEPSGAGTPYIPADCDLEAGCGNIVIYGHHRKDGSMFADLLKYRQQAFYEEHPRILFDTICEPGEYKIVGVMLAPATEEEAGVYTDMRAGNEVEYRRFMEKVKAKSLYETGTEASYGEQLLTLITCEYTSKNGRIIVVAKRADQHIITE